MSDLNTELLNKIDQAVDSLVSILKKQLVSGEGFQKRGLWDRFKNFVSNVWYGRYNQKNPYYFTNTLGDFAGASDKSQPKKESIQRINLKQFLEIRYLFEDLEKNINIIIEEQGSDITSNLRIMKVIDDWAKTLKITLKKIFSDMSKTKTREEIKAKAEISSVDKNDKFKKCIEDLEIKNKEGKISAKDYFAVKSLIDSGNLDAACKVLEKLSKKPVTEVNPDEEFKQKVSNLYAELEVAKQKGMPDPLYKKIKKDIEGYEKAPVDELFNSIKDLIHGTKSRDVEASETKDDSNNFPFNLDDSISSFEKIKSVIRRKEPYKSSFENFRENWSKTFQKRFDTIENFLKKAMSGPVDQNEFLTNMKKYKSLVSQIISNVDQSEIDDFKVEQNISTFNPLNKKEKVAYMKNIINER